MTMMAWRVSDCRSRDPGSTPVVTHVVTNHLRADVLAEVVPLTCIGGSGCSNDVIVTVTSAEDSSEPVGNEQRCQLQSMNYVALTTRVNCSRLLNHYFCMYTV